MKGLNTMQKNTFPKLLTIVLALLLLLSASGYASELKPGSGEPINLSDTDYSDMNNWIRFGGGNKDVDVFAVYPTVTNDPDADTYIALDSEKMRTAAQAWLAKVQDTFIESANTYAPYYRQLNGKMLGDLDSESFTSYTNATPREDIFAAFDYYLTHVNKGERPFILLGHSQGAHLAKELATTFLGGEKYYQHNKNHIITYAIGVSVIASDIAINPNMTFSETKTCTSVIVSWNTTAPSEVTSSAYKDFGTWRDGALVTNPITWGLGGAAPAKGNPGSKIESPNGGYEIAAGYADAVADGERGVLVCYDVDESKYAQLAKTVSKYHDYDILFYFESIRQNVKDRIAAFIEARVTAS